MRAAGKKGETEEMENVPWKGMTGDVMCRQRGEISGVREKRGERKEE